MSHFTKKYHIRAYDAISPTLPSLSQSGHTILITGGGSGIGLSLAQAFISARAARIIIASRSEIGLSHAKTRLIESIPDATPTTIETLALDLSSPASIETAWQELAKRDIAVDVLVLNAADFAPALKISEKSSIDGLRRAYEVNVLGNWQMAVNFIHQGAERGKALVNVSSGAAHWEPVVQPIYSTTKASFAHMLQALADEVPVDQVQMVSLHPGAIYTKAAANHGHKPDSLLWDNVNLPAGFVVWAASSNAKFLHGKFVWAGWDVNELKGMESKIQEDIGFLRIGLQGVEQVHPKGMWTHIREIADAENWTPPPGPVDG